MKHRNATPKLHSPEVKPLRTNWKQKYLDLEKRSGEIQAQFDANFAKFKADFDERLNDATSLTCAMGRILQMVEITDRYQQIEKTNALDCLNRIRTNWTFPGDAKPPPRRPYDYTR